MTDASPKILYLEIDEEVTSIVDRMKTLRNKVVVLVIPNHAVILHSVVNLKLLKKQAEVQGKEISIVTTDKTGRNLASQVGITVYSNVEQPGGKQKSDAVVVKEEHDEEVDTPHLSALEKSKKLRSRLGLVEDLELAEEPVLMSIEDMQKAREEIQERSKNRKNDENDVASKGKSVRYKSDENVVALRTLSPNKKLLFLMFGLSIFILAIVGYFVLPNATVFIQPKLDPIAYTTNITMLDVNRYSNILQDGKKLKMVGTYPVEISELAITEEAPVTGQKFIGGRAKGIITVKNKSARQWQFVTNTRFQSPEGYIFRTTRDLIVTSGAEIDIEVIADEKGPDENFMGSKGNLAPTNFTIPGLGGMSPKLIEGFSKNAFTGGTDEYQHVIDQADIEAAKKLIVEKIMKIAEEKLNEKITQENQEKGTHLLLFKTGNNDSDIYREVKEVIVDQSLIGQTRDTFPIAAKARLVGVAYDTKEIVDIMRKGLEDMVLDTRQLIEVKEDGIGFNVIENQPGEGKIKVEITLHGVTEYKVDDRLGDRIKSKIIGKSAKEALEIIDEMEEVGGVKIETWPFWVHGIPGVRSNINVKQFKE